MHLEIVSHCWKYSRLLMYQLSSLVLYPPSDICITMTVFSSSCDDHTQEVCGFFKEIEVPNVTWRFWNIERGKLLRRAIGRNLAALKSRADWVWFTDCDQLFYRGCLDGLAVELPRIGGPLAFPQQVWTSTPKFTDDELFVRASGSPRVIAIDTTEFTREQVDRATGAMQIANGDVVREVGYCKDVVEFMAPAERWYRTFEDVKFREILGTAGQPVPSVNLFRVEHKPKGRQGFVQL